MHRLILPLIGGLITPLAFEPFGWWPVIFVALGLLFYNIQGCAPRAAAWRGFVYGIGCFGFGTSWVYFSLQTFGGMPVPMAVAAVGLFSAMLAVFPAIACALAALTSRRLPVPLAIAGAWALAEWLRGLGVWAFPWLAAGFSQADSPIGGFAPVLGVYGMSFAVALVSACLATIAVSLRGGSRGLITPVAVTVMTLGIGFALDRIKWTTPEGAPISVGMVQANVDLATKWRPGNEALIRQRYLDLSEELASADLVIWPESAMPVEFARLDKTFFRALASHKADFIFGVIEQQIETSTDQLRMYNSAAVVGADGQSALYRKTHLVPFGEYLPFSNHLRWVLDYLNIPMSDFRPWQDPQIAMAAAGTRVGISICFEDAFARDVLPLLPEAAVLVNISEDAWFGDSFGPPQRLEMGRIRAMETGRPMVRSSNTGVTAVIDAKGRVVKRLPQFVTDVLQADVQPHTGATVFVRFGHWPVLIVSVLLMLAGLALKQKPRRQTEY